jgi:amino acid permease
MEDDRSNLANLNEPLGSDVSLRVDGYAIQGNAGARVTDELNPDGPDPTPLHPGPFSPSDSFTDGQGYEKSSVLGPDGKYLPANGPIITIVLLLNVMIGSWILGVPATFKYAGVVPCLLMIFVLTLLSRYNSAVIQRNTIKVGAEGLEDMTAQYFGRTGTLIFASFVVGVLFIVHLSYILVGTETIMKWLSMVPSIDQTKSWFRPVMTICYAAVPMAVTIPSQLKFLAHLMPLSVAAIILQVVGLSVRAIIDFSKNPKISPTANIATFTFGDLFLSLSVHSGTMTLPADQSAPLKAYVRDLGRQERILTITYIWAYLIYCVPSVLIYLDKGDAIQSNVLMSFDADDWIIIIIQVGVFLKITLIFAGIHIVYQTWWSQLIWRTTRPPNCFKRGILMVITYVLVIVSAIYFTDLLPVLGVGGALSLFGIYVLPTVALMKDRNWELRSWLSVRDIVMILVGTFCTIVTTIFAVQSAILSLSG